MIKTRITKTVPDNKLVISQSIKKATKRLKMEAYFVGSIFAFPLSKCIYNRIKRFLSIQSDKSKLIPVQKTVKLIAGQCNLLFPFFRSICYLLTYPGTGI